MEKECRNCANFSKDTDIELIFFYCRRSHFGKEQVEDYDLKLAETCTDYRPKKQ